MEWIGFYSKKVHAQWYKIGPRHVTPFQGVGHTLFRVGLRILHGSVAARIGASIQTVPAADSFLARST